MELINIDNFNEDRFETAIALGNFDGVHLGHQSLIKQMISISNEGGLNSSVLLFENHTKSTIDGKGPSLITSKEQKYNLVHELGVKTIYSMKFDEFIMKLTPEDFVTEILIKKLNAKAVVVGNDYRFGHKASGDAELLIELGIKHGLKIVIVDPLYLDGDIVSSTRIRKCILSGDVKGASKLLGRDYSILGKVVPGKKIGNKLGFPTANIDPLINFVLPKNGVYSTKTIVDGVKYISATSVGYNPTFRENSIKIESHIIGFAQDIYDMNIELVFVEFLRDEIKFESVELLKKQILLDINKVKLS